MYPIRPWLYIGKYRDPQNLPRLQAHHIQALLLLDELVEYPGIHALYLPIQDGVPFSPPLFSRGVSFLLLEHQLARNVLIACGGGISRSVAFGIAALRETEQLPLLAAYSEIVHINSTALPHAAIWKSLCDYYQEQVPYLEVVRIYNSVQI